MKLLAAMIPLAFALSAAGGAEPKPVSYGRDVRPILSENCFFCHGQDPNQRKADVRLDTEAGQREALVPGKPNESELVKRIFSHEPAAMMPPAKSNRKLSKEQKETLQRWIAEGAKFEGHWAYEPVKRPAVPRVEGVAKPIDAFLRAKLVAKGMAPSPEADRTALIRRLTFDLTGLPPTPKEVDAFVEDKSKDAYEKLVDRLMKRPQYGERMALPWLDAARYADSNGFQQDGDTFQWVWRDWVVKAINDNVPFDRFTTEQLAGDLLPNATLEQKVATAFNRNHLVNGEGGAIPEEQRFVILFDRVDVTATNWLGLTMACSQCHDHKYDPITQRDYYSLMAAFNQVSESGVPTRQSSKTRVAPPFVETPPSKDAAVKIAEMEKTIADLKKAEKPDDAKVKAAEKALADYKADAVPKVMVMADDKPRETHILDRGEYLKKKDVVAFATPGFLPPLPKGAPRNRLGLAQWLLMPENPLTARVAVNRVWQTVFGVGLVRTGEDFGVQSEVPEHRELLDWLAVEFRDRGWDMKALVKLIVMSDTYRQSSKVSAEALKADPENRYYARSPRTRLPAMMLRDLALSASGLLDERIGGKPVYPYQPEGIWDSLAITKERDFTYPASTGQDLYRRSLYTFWRRTVGPANMFDASSRQACKVKPSTTNTPLHALTTLNDKTWTEAARVLAEKAIGTEKETDARLAFAFKRILARMPKEQELVVLRKVLTQQLEHYRSDADAAKKLLSVGESPRNPKLDAAEHAAWTAICSALFNLDEALTRE